MSSKLYSIIILSVFWTSLYSNQLIAKQSTTKSKASYTCTASSCGKLKEFQKCLANPDFDLKSHPNCMQSALNAIRGLSLLSIATNSIEKESAITSENSDISPPTPVKSALPEGLASLLETRAPWMLPVAKPNKHNPDLKVLPGAPIRVCSFDGGGVKGIIPATIIADVEEKVGRPITEICDIFVGTSTGGLIAIFLTMPDEHGGQKYTAAHMVSLYKELAKKVFNKSGLKWIRSHTGVFRSKYNPSTLMKLLQHYVGYKKVSDTVKPLVVTSYDLKNKSIFPIATRYGIMSPKMDLFLYEAGRATSAAPTFFPPLNVTLSAGIKLKLVDGGVMANNPSLLALMEAKKIYPGRSYSILSLGTGDYKDPKAPTKSGIIHMLGPTVEALFKGPMQLTDEAIKASVANGNYHRFSPTLTKAQDAMDNVASSNIRSLEAVCRDQVFELPAYKNFIKKLKVELLLKPYLRAIDNYIERTKNPTYRHVVEKMDERIQHQIKTNGKDLAGAYEEKHRFQKIQVLGEARLIPDYRIRKAFIYWIINGENGFEWAKEWASAKESIPGHRENEALDADHAATVEYMEAHPDVYDRFVEILNNPETIRENLILKSGLYDRYLGILNDSKPIKEGFALKPLASSQIKSPLDSPKKQRTISELPSKSSMPRGYSNSGKEELPSGSRRSVRDSFQFWRDREASVTA